MCAAASFIDDQGTPIPIGAEVGRGGEGSVAEVLGTQLVAKLYHKPADSLKAAKLEAMVRRQSPGLSSLAAWPVKRILDPVKRQTWGLVMPRVVDHREVHHLYSPAHRKADFPSADWAFLIHVARNCAAAFATIHAAGHVVGDVNQSGILVSKNGTVKLIDCDSFQICDGPKLFTCDVGVAHFTPPELQGQAFRGLRREPGHDAFGLAVVIFHLLFMGRHPFAGRFHGPGDMPIELSIKQGRFAYGSTAASMQMTPPPHALRLSHVTPAVADLFERSFRSGVSTSFRPSASEWVAALEALKKELVTCGAFSGHKFFAGKASACPWCDIEKGGGPDLFISITAARKINSSFNIAVFWQDVERLKMPEAAVAAVKSAAVHRHFGPSQLPRRTVLWGWATAGAAATAVLCLIAAVSTAPDMGAFALGFFFVWIFLRSQSPYAKTRYALVDSLRKARRELQSAEADWVSRMAEAQKHYAEKKAALARSRVEFEGLPQLFRRQSDELESKRHEHQLNAFLRKHYIEDATIKGIGAGRISVLKSFGIETAFDATSARVSGVSGFGPALTAAVVSWRKSVEARFRFDPAKGVDPAERAQLAQRQSQQRSNLEAALQRGLSELRHIVTLANDAGQLHHKRTESAAAAILTASSHARSLPLPLWLA